MYREAVHGYSFAVAFISVASYNNISSFSLSLCFSPLFVPLGAGTFALGRIYLRAS